MSSPLPTLQYLVAFQNNPTDDPALITSVASPGTLGANNVWSDITAYVDSHQIRRGRQHELSQFEAGTLQLHLNNQDGRFSPWNASGPYFGFLLPRKLVQVRATWSATVYKRFTGHVDAWPVEWPDPISQWATLHATDAFRMLNLADITTTGYPAQVKTDGAAAYFRLNDPSGATTLTDATGNGNLLVGAQTPIPTPASVSTWLGQTGLLITNTASSLVLAQNDAVCYPSQSVGAPYVTGTAATMEFWVSSTSGGLVNATMTWQHSGTMFGAGVNWGTTTMNSILNGTIGGSTATVTLQDGNPHHVVITADTAGGTFNVYVDAVNVISASGITYTGGPWANGNFTYIDNVSDTGTLLVQELAFYPTALSSGTISNHFSLASFPQEATDSRIGRVLNAVNWSSGARALDAGYSTVQKVTSSLTTTSSLSHMQQVEGTEGGALFMTGDGKVKFLSRQTVFGNSLYTTSQQTVGDNIAGGDMPLQPGPVLTLDDIDLYNEASATRTGGMTQIFTDTTSITSYGRSTWNPPATLVGISDVEVLGLTEYIVNKFKTPVVRIQSISVDLLELIQPNLVAHLLSLDLLQQITVERTSPPDGHTAFSQLANIERIEESVAPDSWKVTFQLAKADPAWWILGTSQLGTNTRIAY